MAAQVVAEFEKQFPGGPKLECALALDTSGPCVTVLFGPSGAGKTTILRCLAGLERPDTGRIAFGDETWFNSSRGVCLPPQRRRVGFLFQDYALFPHLSVEDNVGYALHALEHRARAGRAAAMLRLLGAERLAARRPRQLSGGERQRVALARALAPEPRLLLLDEPLSALDAPAREELRGSLRRLLTTQAKPTLLVTHDRTEALALGDRIAVLASGRLRQVGPIEDVFAHPADVEVARAVGVETVVRAHVVTRPGEGLITIQAGRALLTALDPGPIEGEVLACIRAEEVVLERGPVGEVSARNRLQGHVVSMTVEGPLVRVRLDCGFPLASLVTRQACRDLSLSEGEIVTAIVKSPSVHLIPREAR